jgi:hypothetical protein
MLYNVNGRAECNLALFWKIQEGHRPPSWNPPALKGHVAYKSKRWFWFPICYFP